jgi:hypothetical protein
MRILINRCYGGFGLSDAAVTRLQELGVLAYHREIERNDPKLLQVFDELGQATNGPFAELQAIEVPEGVEWQIEEYDGYEHVAEKHRTWPN